MRIVQLAKDEVLIVGAGLAGLFCALKLTQRRAIILSPAPLGMASASAWAQGGMAAALAPGDSPKAHAADTLAAGAGLTDPIIADLIATEGPHRVRDLIAMGVPFDRADNGALALSLEAAHSFARVARVAGDLAGREIMSSLTKLVSTASHIDVHPHVHALALLQDDRGNIRGVVARDGNGDLVAYHAPEVVLATGGTGGLYAVTTNPITAAGQGLGMAARCGALVADAEFVQFHPTAIDVGADPAPLATEALRGEGAILVNRDGAPFMHRYDSRKDLAPRDVVARAVAQEIADGRGAALDARSAIGADFAHHFPTVYAACMAANIDPVTQNIPIAPAAHYHMGGIVTDMWGRSSLLGLSVIGETASTGAHGANRLASNSLLEAVVFAHRVAHRLNETALAEMADDMPAPPPIFSLPDTARTQLRQTMARHVGVVRDASGLQSALRDIDDLMAAHGPTNELICARLMTQGALNRTESRGGHFRRDHPQPAANAERQYQHWTKP